MYNDTLNNEIEINFNLLFLIIKIIYFIYIILFNIIK